MNYLKLDIVFHQVYVSNCCVGVTVTYEYLSSQKTDFAVQKLYFKQLVYTVNDYSCWHASTIVTQDPAKVKFLVHREFISAAQDRTAKFKRHPY